MELLGMLHHLASWHFLAMVALLDVCFILLHLINPSPIPLLPSPLPHRQDSHDRLLERIAQERQKVGEDMRERLRDLRGLARTLRTRTEVLRALNGSIGRLENSVRLLHQQHPPTDPGLDVP